MANTDFSAAIAAILAGPGASQLSWQVASRCSCWNPDTEQPQWGHPTCGGYGVVYAAPVTVNGMFRSQSRWTSSHMEGEFPLGEAQLTTDVTVKPGYTDRRVRDRFTVVQATGDSVVGRVFLPAASPVPFLIGNQHLAWRVQLQALEQANRVTPQP